MRRIILYDNRFGDNGKVFSDLNPIQIELLKRYGNKSLEELKSSSCGVIDLSHSHLDSIDRKQLKFFEYHEKDEDCRLDTGILMGALRFRDSETGEAIQVEVLSRFDDDENSENVDKRTGVTMCKPNVASLQGRSPLGSHTHVWFPYLRNRTDLCHQ